jgi:hypothetical protein
MFSKRHFALEVCDLHIFLPYLPQYDRLWAEPMIAEMTLVLHDIIATGWSVPISNLRRMFQSFKGIALLILRSLKDKSEIAPERKVLEETSTTAWAT